MKKWSNLTKICLALVLSCVLGLSGLGVGVVLKPNTAVSTIGQGQVVLTIGTVEAGGTADYSCDGVADNAQFQLAFNALPNAGGVVGGKIVVLAGTYNFAAPVTRPIDNITVEGMGRSTYITGAPAFLVGGNNWVSRNIRLDANGINAGAITTWTGENIWFGATYYAYTTGSSIAAASWDIPSGRGPTFKVAASNASVSSIAQADYVCDGAADHTEINNAITAASAAGGGIVSLSEGTFTCSARITNRTGVTIRGQGMGATRLVLNAVQAGGFVSLNYPYTDMGVFDLKIDSAGNSDYALDITGFVPGWVNEMVERISVDNVWCVDGNDDIVEIEFARDVFIGTIYTTGVVAPTTTGSASNVEIGDECDRIVVDKLILRSIVAIAAPPGSGRQGLNINRHAPFNFPKNVLVNQVYVADVHNTAIGIQARNVNISQIIADAPGENGLIINGSEDIVIDSLQIKDAGMESVVITGASSRIKLGTVQIGSSGLLVADYSISAVSIRGSSTQIDIDDITIIDANKKILRGISIDTSSPVRIGKAHIEGSGEGAIGLYKSSYNNIGHLTAKNNSNRANNTYSTIKLSGAGGVNSTYNVFNSLQVIEDAANKAKYGYEEATALDNYNMIIAPSIVGVVTDSILKLGLMSEIVGGPYERDFIMPVCIDLSSISQTLLVTGGTVTHPNRMRVSTGVTALSSARRHGNLRQIFGLDGNWSKHLEFRFGIARFGTDAEAVSYMQFKSVQTIGDLAAKGLGIKISNFTLIGESYGAARGTQALLVMADTTLYLVKIVLNPSIPSITWYVYDATGLTLLATATETTANNIPSGVAGDFCYVQSINNGATGGVNDEFDVSNMDIKAFK